MKNILKVVGIVLLGIAAAYLIPCIVMWNQIKQTPDVTPAKYLTDYTLVDEKTYEISEGDITMRIPTYYASTNVRDYYSVVCDGHLKNRNLLIIYKPLGPVMEKIMPGSGQEYIKRIQEFNNTKPGYPVSLFYDVPDDIFEAVKRVYLADKSDFNFWNPISAFELKYYLDARAKLDERGKFTAIYERDDVRAVVAEYPDEPGSYVVLVIPRKNPNNIYGFILETPDMDDVTKLLNNFEFNTGL